MKKSNLNTLILIGGLALGGYLLYKYFTGQGSTGGGGVIPLITPTEPTPTVPVITPTGGTEPIVTITPSTGDVTVTPIQTTVQRPVIQYTATNPTGGTSTITIPAPIGVTPQTLTQPQNQSWTGATYGQAGQPSVSFLYNTVTSPSTVRPSTALTPQPISPIAAGAPPRVVAKINAGSWY